MFLLMFLTSYAMALTETCRITSQLEFPAVTTSSQALAADSYRKCLVFQNKGSQDVYIKFGSVHTASEGFKLSSGASWEPIVPPNNSVFIESASGTQTVNILSGK